MSDLDFAHDDAPASVPLRALGIPMAPEHAQLILASFLEGEDVNTDDLRDALTLYRDQHRALQANHDAISDAWDEVVSALVEMGKQAASLSGMHYETHIPDEWLHGHITGEALTWRHVCSALTLITNAMHLRKAAHTGAK